MRSLNQNLFKLFFISFITYFPWSFGVSDILFNQWMKTKWKLINISFWEENGLLYAEILVHIFTSSIFLILKKNQLIRLYFSTPIPTPKKVSRLNWIDKMSRKLFLYSTKTSFIFNEIGSPYFMIYWVLSTKQIWYSYDGICCVSKK